MKQRILKLFAVISLISLMSLHLHAQVTIGVGEEPVKGALLDLKSKLPGTDNVTSETGGLVLARVKLENQNTLEPFIKTTDPDWIADATTKIKTKHTGLIVYNLTNSPADSDENKCFSPGLYLWNGAKWEIFTTQGAANGLHINSAAKTIELGGDLSQAATSININAATQALTFDITNNSSTDTNHGILIPGLQEQANSKVVVANTTTGKLGIATVVPAGLAFYQAKSSQFSIGTTLSAANVNNIVVATWEVGDKIFDNIMTLDDSNDLLEFNQGGKYEISASVSYRPKANGVGSGTECLLNAYLQVNSGSGWINYSAVRGLWIGTANYYRQTMSIPPVILEAKAGDKIRLAIQIPPNTATAGAYLGTAHDNGNGSDTGIAAPYGSEYSKTLKIMAIEML